MQQHLFLNNDTIVAFNAEEIKEYRKIGSEDQRLKFLASRWAAKEAAYKAFGKDRILFPEIVVQKRSVARLSFDLRQPQFHSHTRPRFNRSASGVPQLRFEGEAQEKIKEAGVTNSQLSISHDEDYATAFVIFQRNLEA